MVLSARGGLQSENLISYLKRVKHSSHVSKDDMIWERLRHEEIHIHKNKDLRGLQVADCIASSAFKAVEPSEFGTLEPRYIQELRPMFERHPFSAYQAITFWPAVPQNIFKARLQWLER